MSEALKYTEEETNGLGMCQALIHDVESRLLKTDWHNDLQNAKNDVMAKNGELRWRTTEEATASKALRKSAAMRINAPVSKGRCAKTNGRVTKVHQPNDPLGTESNASTRSLTPTTPGKRSSMKPDAVVGEDRVVHPITAASPFDSSYYQGRQLIYKMSYCNGSSASAAASNLQKGFPLHRGDFLWLLDQYLRQEFPDGGIMNCADPSVFADIGSVWPSISRFCTVSTFSRHPSADYLHTVAERASQGTYSTMQAVVSLNAALVVLRTSVVKKSFVKIVDTRTKQQRRYTTFIINATCTSGLRQL